ncbi:MAG: UvrD-helicase domain-containing protein [Sulfurifustaceae bacterium]
MATAPTETSTLAAIDPHTNAVVHAAAGTGKTWLLVSRLVRLLLQGAAPSSILAITFTRKAAAEMRVRLSQRLLALSQASDAELRSLLQEIDIVTGTDVQQRARRLYEELLVTPHELRVTTFHAFCQELLARFAFEAGIPPAFEIAEQTTEIEAAAWRALDRDLLRDDSAVTVAMERLLRNAGGLDNVRAALQEFLNHRSDWWAYTEDEPDPIAYATRQLQHALAIDPNVHPFDTFANDVRSRELLRSLLMRLDAATPASLVSMRDSLHDAANAPTGTDFCRLVSQALLTKDGEPRAFRVPNDFAKKIGSANADALMREREELLARLHDAIERGKRHAAWERNRDWCTIGARLLDHFQEQKRTAGVLDFADLEWLAYRLLSRSRYAEWVQYKLDQRIDHLLVDEFQDTNPTQWRLLLPLLQEMAAGSAERNRSVFLVGDEKQSIYRFRRADPALFAVARDWLAAHSNAQVHEQHISWRSSPAIVRFVNLLFDVHAADNEDADARDHRLPNFRTHDTHRKDLWGHAELLPLVMRLSGTAMATAFRHPLEQPRFVEEDQRRRREGDLVAQKILSLLGRPIRDGDRVRPLRYGDIMILVRRRTYAGMYEAALRAAGIPYAGAGRGNFLDCLEVRDIIDLLRLLIAPFENVALAAVLRSPIFAVTDDDLLALASTEGATWFDRLIALGADDEKEVPREPLSSDAQARLARAARLLRVWRAAADRIPVHDLLDRIYFEADVPERYTAAAPAHLRARVAANLTRLLDFALEADGGRFPSLARFLSRLEVLTQEENESLGAGADTTADQVRLLTIHAAKGLESPVVFLVDAARENGAPERGAEVLIDWPIEQARPRNFVLLGRRSDADSWSRAVAQRQGRDNFQEETNLLYVALTRARQYLFVSGCEAGRRKGNGSGLAGDESRGWYGYIERRFAAVHTSADAATFELQLHPISAPDDSATANLCGSITHGLPPAFAPTQTPLPLPVSVDPALTHPFHLDRLDGALEQTEDETAVDADIAFLSAAMQRGVVIHRMLERLTTIDTTRERARLQVWHEFGAELETDWLEACWNEACAVIDTPALAHFFDGHRYDEARNEVAVLYHANGNSVMGIIDRLLIAPDRLVLVDYKTDRTESGDFSALVSRYTPQLRLYAEGVRRLWPGRSIEAVLLFTQARMSVSVPV